MLTVNRLNWFVFQTNVLQYLCAGDLRNLAYTCKTMRSFASKEYHRQIAARSMKDVVALTANLTQYKRTPRKLSDISELLGIEGTHAVRDQYVDSMNIALRTSLSINVDSFLVESDSWSVNVVKDVHSISVYVPNNQLNLVHSYTFTTFTRIHEHVPGRQFTQGPFVMVIAVFWALARQKLVVVVLIIDLFCELQNGQIALLLYDTQDSTNVQPEFIKPFLVKRLTNNFCVFPTMWWAIGVSLGWKISALSKDESTLAVLTESSLGYDDDGCFCSFVITVFEVDTMKEQCSISLNYPSNTRKISRYDEVGFDMAISRDGQLLMVSLVLGQVPSYEFLYVIGTCDDTTQTASRREAVATMNGSRMCCAEFAECNRIVLVCYDNDQPWRTDFLLPTLLDPCCLIINNDISPEERDIIAERLGRTFQDNG